MSTATPTAKPAGPAGASAKPAQAKSAKSAPAAPSVTMRPWLVACITCDQKHPLAGLWVLFRAKPADNKTDVPFKLGITDSGGFLAPTDCDSNLLKAITKIPPSLPANKEPEVLKKWPASHQFVPNAEYEFIFVQHPDHTWADDALKLLNEGGVDPEDPSKPLPPLIKGGDLTKLRHLRAPKSPEVKPTEKPGTSKEAPRISRNDWYSGPTVLKPDETGAVRVPEDPALFLPGGDPFYGKWCLFRDMPSGKCDPVQSQVYRLQAHLGALRFPHGDQEHPYCFAVEKDDHVAWNTAGGPNGGQFDVRTWGAVIAFQHTTEANEQDREKKRQEALAKAEEAKRKAAAAKAAAAAAKGKGKGKAPPPPPKPPPPPRDEDDEEEEDSDDGTDADEGSGTPAKSVSALRDPDLYLPFAPIALADKSIRKLLISGPNHDPVITTEKARRTDDNLEELREHWAYLKGSRAKWPTIVPQRADGVVDFSTAAAIKHWLDEGLRKPGPVLVKGWAVHGDPRPSESTPPPATSANAKLQAPGAATPSPAPVKPPRPEPRPTGYCMRMETAVSLFAWGHLVRALGVKEGVPVVHAYRNILAEVKTGVIGVAARSPHKTGLATDTSGKNYRHGAKPWPVVYVRTTPEQQKDTVRYKYFEVFAPSKQLLPGMLGGDKTTTLTIEELRKSLLDQLELYSSTVDDKGIPQFRAAFSEAKASLAAAIRSDNFFKLFFAETVRPWKWDGTKASGGEPGVPVTPQQHEALHQVFHERNQMLEAEMQRHRNAISKAERTAQDKKATADEKERARAQADLSRKALAQALEDYEALQVTKETPATMPPPKGDAASFLNLSEVARVTRLFPINATAKWNLTLTDLASSDLDKIAPALAAALAVPEWREERMKEQAADAKADPSKEKKDDGKGAPKDESNPKTAPDYHRLWVYRSDGSGYGLPLDALDGAFMDAWKKTLDTAVPISKHKGAKAASLTNGPYELKSPQLIVSLSIDEARDGDADAVAKLLEPHSDRYFYRPAVGSGGIPEVRKGSEWVAHLKEMAEGLKKKREERAAKSPAPATPESSPDGKPSGKAKPAAKTKGKPERKPKDPIDMTKEFPLQDWSLTLQPVFLKGYTPPEPPKDEAKAGDGKPAPAKVDESRIPLLPSQRIKIPFKGSPRGQEWWHFQRTDIGTPDWWERMREIGWVEEVVGVGTSDTLYGRPGIGHAKS